MLAIWVGVTSRTGGYGWGVAQRENATPETSPQEEGKGTDGPPSVKEPSEVDEKLDPDQEVMQPDSS